MINRVSIDEASKNFLKVIQSVDETGAAVILKDGRQYIIYEYNEGENDKERHIDSVKFREIAAKVLDKHIEAFRELAK